MNGAAESRLAAWNGVLTKLGLEAELIEASRCGLPAALGPIVLLPRFGAPNGMLLFPDRTEVLHLGREIVERGFGYSVVATPCAGLQERESMVEMLRDWGWCGPESDRPTWY